MPKTLLNLFVKFVTFHDTREVANLLMQNDDLRAQINSIIRTELSIDSDVITPGSIMYSLGYQPPSIERVIRTMVGEEQSLEFRTEVNKMRLENNVKYAEVIQMIDMTENVDVLT